MRQSALLQASSCLPYQRLLGTSLCACVPFFFLSAFDWTGIPMPAQADNPSAQDGRNIMNFEDLKLAPAIV
ncbi:MAG: hypothetical protein ABIR55_12615, partial [Burkholderiaceae bacterium]